VLARADRPGLAEALAYLRSGDTLVVWKLDRLGRSMSHLIEKIGELAARGIGFRSLTESIDTTTPGGMLVFVNRRPNGTPNRRAKGPPLALRGSVEAGCGFRAAGVVGRA